LLGQTFVLIASDASAALLAFGTIVTASTALDLAAPNGGNFATLPILVVQYYMVRRLIDRQQLRAAESHAGFGSYFVLGLITGLPTLLGFVAFIVPGFYLCARWAMSGAALLAENDGATTAARRSWHGTAGYVLPIAMAQLVLAIPLIVGAITIVGAGISAGIASAMLPATGRCLRCRSSSTRCSAHRRSPGGISVWLPTNSSSGNRQTR
jgi:hypothetical protein